MTTTCLDQDFPCQDLDYSEFDDTAASELNKPIAASLFVNDSNFCTMVQTDMSLQFGDLTHQSFLKRLHGKTGIYHLWIDYDDCDDHQTYTMQCVYVGKGFGEVRINDHIKSKWPNDFVLYVTFSECENRLSKYYEQLFLDTYNFCLNKNENRGTKELFAVWSEELHMHGTESYGVIELSGVQSFDDI